MNNILKLLWLTYFLIASLLSFADSPGHIVVRGKVTCQKKAVENVAVSDGKSIIANVYNYDQEWNIYVFENNNFCQHDGEVLGRRSTNHLFKATLKDQTSKVSVLVIDRFGNKYVKDL